MEELLREAAHDLSAHPVADGQVVDDVADGGESAEAEGSFEKTDGGAQAGCCDGCRDSRNTAAGHDDVVGSGYGELAGGFGNVIHGDSSGSRSV